MSRYGPTVPWLHPTWRGPSGTGEVFLPGRWTTINWNFPIRGSIGANTKAVLHTPIAVSRPYKGAEHSPLSVIFRVFANNGAAGQRFEITKDVTSADGIQAHAYRKILWTIPATHFQGNGNGTLEIWFSMTSRSNGPALLLQKPHLSWDDTQ